MKRLTLVTILVLFLFISSTPARQEPVMPIEQHCSDWADFMIQLCGGRGGSSDSRCPGSWLDFYIACILGN